MYNFIITAILMVAFFMSVGAYCLGLKHGKQLSNGNIPNVTLNPVKKVIEAVEQHEAKKEEKKVTDDLQDIMSASRESMLNHIKAVK